MLEISHITKDFVPPFSLGDIARRGFRRGASVRALDDVSFSLPKGRVLAILGPNGAGKTTLLKILSTLILPDDGTVSLNGFILGRDDDKIKASIGLMASSDRSFYWRLTGRQNLEFFAAMHGLSKTRTRTRIEELFGEFDINYGGRRFDSYSTGMQQKFALMRALLHDPEILLLDEPTKSLDYAASVALRSFITDILLKKHGKTVIFTTHHMDEAAAFAEIFLILRKGRLFAAGSLEELRQRASSPSATLGELFLKFTGSGHHA
jgi:ABC-2 type transport system ATP-binding protein